MAHAKKIEAMLELMCNDVQEAISGDLKLAADYVDELSTTALSFKLGNMGNGLLWIWAAWGYLRLPI